MGLQNGRHARIFGAVRGILTVKRRWFCEVDGQRGQRGDRWPKAAKTTDKKDEATFADPGKSVFWAPKSRLKTGGF